ncbi:Adenylosuccinate lyase [Euphorbia peplus]|nr:Adenylosuccinate lyase [Euphorbia peplus]
MRFLGASSYMIMKSIKNCSSYLPIAPPATIRKPGELFTPSIIASSSICPIFRRYYMSKETVNDDEWMWSTYKDDLLPFNNLPPENCYSHFLSCHLSEGALSLCRVKVQIEWLRKLSQMPEIFPTVPKLGSIHHFTAADAAAVKKLEEERNSAMKAVNDFLKIKFKSDPEISKVLDVFHIACSSEDINNLAHGVMLKESIEYIIFPMMDHLIKMIADKAEGFAPTAMIYRDPQQEASTTTLGKELMVYAVRLRKQMKRISKIKIEGNFGGSIGNYNAHFVAYPNVNWPQIAKEFVESFGLRFNPYVSQIEPHDYMAMLFSGIVVFNNILNDFHKEICSYLQADVLRGLEYPTNFANIALNLGIASETLSHLSKNLRISRWQHDLRDVIVGLGYSAYVYQTAKDCIRDFEANESQLIEELDESWEVLIEAIKIVVIRYEIQDLDEEIEELKEDTTRKSISNFIKGLDIPENKKQYLLSLSPHTYTGASVKLATKTFHWPESDNEENMPDISEDDC